MDVDLTKKEEDHLTRDKVNLERQAEINNQYTLLQRSPSGEFLLSELRREIEVVRQSYLAISAIGAGAMERLAAAQGKETILHELIYRIESHESRASHLAEESQKITDEQARRSERSKTRGPNGTLVNKDAS